MGDTASLAATTSLTASQTASGIFAARAQGSAESRLLRTNADLARRQAEDALRRGERAAKEHEAAGRRLVGTQRTGFAAQGVELESGSALDVQADTLVQAALDANQIRANAVRESFGYRMQASDFEARARMARFAAGNAARETLLTGGLSFARDVAK